MSAADEYPQGQTLAGSIVETFVQALAGAFTGWLFHIWFGTYFGLQGDYFAHGSLMSIHFTAGLLTGGTIRRIAVRFAKGHQTFLGASTETLIKYSLNFFRGVLFNVWFGPLCGVVMPFWGNVEVTLATTVIGIGRSLWIRLGFERLTQKQFAN